MHQRNREPNMNPPRTVLEKNWVHHNMDGSMTTIIRFLGKKDDGNYILAVGRAYKSTIDKNYSRKIGRELAQKRLNKHSTVLNHWKLRNKVFNEDYNYFVWGKEYGGDPQRESYRAYDARVTFAIGGETILNPSEMELWHNKILPRIEKELDV